MRIKNITKNSIVGIILISFILIPFDFIHAEEYIYSQIINGEIQSQTFPDKSSCDQRIKSNGNSGTCSVSYNLLAPLVQDKSLNDVKEVSFPTYMMIMFRVIISLASVIAVLMIVYGGVMYMTRDNFSQKQEGKEIIQRTLFGMALIITCWVVLYTINPDLINFGNTEKSIDEVQRNTPSTPSSSQTLDETDRQLEAFFNDPKTFSDHKPPQGQSTRDPYRPTGREIKTPGDDTTP